MARLLTHTLEAAPFQNMIEGWVLRCLWRHGL